MAGTLDGLLVLDKPGGMTSRDAVDRALRWFPRKTRMGHTGTLDPLATGVLVLCLGQATRVAEYVQAQRKVYRSTFRLGERSTTDDADGEVSPVPDAPVPPHAAVEAALAGFLGAILQVPPAFSAAKVTGQRAYALARKGETVELAPRTVQVYGLEILHYAPPDLTLEVRCGKGTYIRSLARDLGERLGCGAHVTMLRRTAVGPFRVDDAVTLEMDLAQVTPRLRSLAEGLVDLPCVQVGPDEAVRFVRGQAVPLTSPGPEGPAGEVVVRDGAGRLLGIGRADPAAGVVRPDKVLAVS